LFVAEVEDHGRRSPIGPKAEHARLACRKVRSSQ